MVQSGARCTSTHYGAYPSSMYRSHQLLCIFKDSFWPSGQLNALSLIKTTTTTIELQTMEKSQLLPPIKKNSSGRPLLRGQEASCNTEMSGSECGIMSHEMFGIWGTRGIQSHVHLGTYGALVAPGPIHGGPWGLIPPLGLEVPSGGP